MHFSLVRFVSRWKYDVSTLAGAYVRLNCVRLNECFFLSPFIILNLKSNRVWLCRFLQNVRMNIIKIYISRFSPYSAFLSFHCKIIYLFRSWFYTRISDIKKRTTLNIFDTNWWLFLFYHKYAYAFSCCQLLLYASMRFSFYCVFVRHWRRNFKFCYRIHFSFFYTNNCVNVLETHIGRTFIKTTISIFQIAKKKKDRQIYIIFRLRFFTYVFLTYWIFFFFCFV